jgi:hypothetical protein
MTHSEEKQLLLDALRNSGCPIEELSNPSRAELLRILCERAVVLWRIFQQPRSTEEQRCAEWDEVLP